ncbi:MAG: hypothetical protein ACXABY_21255 [Candidatus Thorarchaeota archaeon]|jgi:DNA-binding phage protein
MIIAESRLKATTLANILHFLETQGINTRNRSEAVRNACEFTEQFIPNVFKDEDQANLYLLAVLGEAKRDERMANAAKVAQSQSEESMEESIQQAVKQFKQKKGE